MIYVRRDIWALEAEQTWHPITLAYAKAVRRLRKRRATNPTSWSYQAAIHGSASASARAGWNQCQHGGWYFLPWHRLYLYYFERIVRAAVEEDGGPDDWALPYWNYDAGGQANTLPQPFRERRLPDGSRNPLYVARRASGINVGVTALPPEITSPTRALSMGTFTPLPRPGFGGGATGVIHFWNEFGGLEQTPHNDIHVAVGGSSGLMIDPDQAALDPIFWLHHANIDRLWNVWSADPQHAAPTDPTWLDETFQLFDEDGNQAVDAVSRTIDAVGQLDYEYDDAVPAMPGIDVGGPMMPQGSGSPPEMVGASEGPVALTGSAASVDVQIDEQAGPAGLAADDATPSRVYLSVEHVDADRAPGTVYGVYLEDPQGGPDARRHVGNVSLFGIEKIQASRRDRDADRDLRLVFDVTDVARELGQGELRGKKLRVTFEPLIGGTAPPSLEAVDEELEPTIRIGRVSFFTE